MKQIPNRMCAYTDDPWNVPVPVKPCDWESLHPEHADLAIRTDLAAISSFRVPGDRPADDSILHADLQIGSGENILSRLGSGRAGFYKEKYLKGVGRTQLAANWADGQDTYHATGHLFPSAAIREYVASAYLQAKGAAHLIVPCEGILLRPLDPEFRREVQSFADRQSCPLPAVDLRFQAISVKSAGFARFSNINWLLASMGPSARSVAAAAYRMQAYCLEPEEPWPSLEDCTPSSIVASLSRAVSRGVDAFQEYFRLGVWWGSYYNNFTMDGRFLDLEVPIIHGSPFIGCFFHHPTPEMDASQSPGQFSPVGMEVLDYAVHVLASIDSFVSRLRLFCKISRDRRAVAFLAGLADAIDGEFGPDHLLRSRDALCDLITDLLVESGASRHGVRRFVEWEYDSYFGEVNCVLPVPHLRPRPGNPSRPEPMWYSTALEAVSLLDAEPSSVPDGEAEFVNEMLTYLDSQTSLDDLLEGLRQVEDALGARMAPTVAVSRLALAAVE